MTSIACLEERTHHLDAPFTHGEEERRESGIERRIDVGARFDERPHDRRVPFGCGPHERGLSVPLTRVVFRAAHEQRLHRVDAARRARPVMSTVSPPFIVAFASAPASSNSLTTAALPFVQASASGGTP